MIKSFEFASFRELNASTWNSDYHLHTNWVHGGNSSYEMAEFAKELGLQSIAFVEHARSAFEHWWFKYVEEIRNLQSSNLETIDILVGMEANAIGSPGNIDVTKKMIASTDIVLASVHGYYDEHNWSKLSPKAFTFDEALHYEQEHLLGLCLNKDVNIIGHAFHLFRTQFGNPPKDHLASLLEKALATETVIEINLQYHKGWNEFFDALADINPKVSIGSNAHSVGQLLSPSEQKGVLFK